MIHLYFPHSRNVFFVLKPQVGFMPNLGLPLALIGCIYPKQHVHGTIHRFVSAFVQISIPKTILNYIDEMLFAFMVPLLPYIFENRLGLDTTLTQRYTSLFLVEGALISIISSPFIGDIADRTRSKKSLLLTLLVMTLISVLCLSMTTSRTPLENSPT